MVSSKSMQFQNEAQKRAEDIRQQRTPNHSTNHHPLLEQTSAEQQFVVKTAIDPESARKEWRRHGEGLSQASEEKRRPQRSTDVVVRILAAETRKDISGSNFTAYVISVLKPGSSTPILVEHRYSDFDRLQSTLKKHNIQLETAFPSKHLAGRIGNWTPSLALAPSQHEDLVSYRKVQLDLWLVDLCGASNRGQLPAPVHEEVDMFLSGTSNAPCERENDICLNTSVERGLRWSNPLSFTLGSSIRQATYTIQYMCLGGISNSDQSIPLDLIHQAKGLCFLTVFKAGLVVSGKVGTGLVISRKDDGSWGAPSALGTVGLGWGAQIGGDITHYLVVLTTKEAVNAFCVPSSITLGGEIGVAVGPLGRGATSHISSSSISQPAYAYAHSHGLFVGISLEGSILKARHDVNTKFYGRSVEVQEILSYMNAPNAAKPLYDALKLAHEQDIPEEGLRPSTLFASSSQDIKTSMRPVSPSTTIPTNGGVVTPVPGDIITPTIGYETPIAKKIGNQ
mmetsp:Transcript_1929/g.2677  ORF Transcript_1929/g.2677 Transcript_1929/m.2677 type:complete len:509 (+) Transcript_1929:71-1597(+)